MNVDTWAVVLATFFGPIAALLITFFRDGRAQKYNRRLHAFRILMATRRIGISNDHVNALNLIEVDFYKCKSVEAAWRSYQEHLNTRFPKDDEAAAMQWGETKERRLAQLLFQMAKVLKFNISELALFRGGYAPEGWAHKESRQNDLLDFFHDIHVGEKDFPIWLKGVTQPQQQEQGQQANAAPPRR